MKIFDEVKAIFSRYELKPLVLPDGHGNVYSLINANPDLKKDYIPEKNDTYFMKKYGTHVPKGWYGIDVGNPINPMWMEILDEVIELCVKSDPNFEIHQVKLKFGGIRFYVHSEIIEDIFEAECLIEGKLYDDALIY
jgi:hypothetical protein